jgi:hypothetical protein
MFANVSNESYTFLSIESTKFQKLVTLTPYSIQMFTFKNIQVRQLVYSLLTMIDLLMNHES